MVIKLSTGKELTLEEVKEVIDKFQEMFGDTVKEYIPYPIYPTQPYVYPYTNEPYYTICEVKDGY